MILLSWSKAEGECQDGIHSLCSLRAAPQATKEVPNLELALRPKLQDKQRGLSHRKTGGVPQSTSCTMHWGWKLAKDCLSYCHGPVGPRNARPPGLQVQAIKGVSWAASAKTRRSGSCKAPLQKTLALRSTSEMRVNIASPPKLSGKDCSQPLDACLIRSLPLRPQS